jgi:hypothetical protein
MSAFLDLLSAYAIWIYIVGVVGILFGIKMLADSRRLSRATMFTLEQEQAGDQAFRAIVVMVVFALLIGGVSVINAFIAPSRPTPIPVVPKETAVAFTPVLILPTYTTVPTLTPEPATPTPTVPPTRSPQPTAAVQPTTEASPPSASPTLAPAQGTLNYPQPSLQVPRDNEHFAASRIQFIWGQNQLPPQLPPGQFYRLTVKYTDRNSNAPVILPKCTANSSIWTMAWSPLAGAQGYAVNGYTWSVIVMEVPSGSPADCDAGVGTAISPPSEPRTFFWP